MRQAFDYLVLGSGVAGLSFALQASRHGTVALLAKRARSETNTVYAQGGIAAVMSLPDTVEEHVHDTLVAGGGLCREDAVRVTLSEGPARVRELTAQLTDVVVNALMKRKPDGGAIHIEEIQDQVELPPTRRAAPSSARCSTPPPAPACSSSKSTTPSI